MWFGAKRGVWGWWSCLGLLVLLAAGLRFCGLDFALPNLARPDEQNVSGFAVTTILQSFADGRPSLDPGFFEYPSLYIYLLLILYSVDYCLGHWTGQFPGLIDYIMLYLSDWSHFHWLARLLTASFGVLTVPLTAFLAKSLTRNRWIALAAAFLLAVTHLHSRDSHFGVTDVPATALVIACLWACLSYQRTRQMGWIYSAAVLAGLAAGMKYPVALVTLSVLLSYWLFPPVLQTMPQRLVTLGLLLLGSIGVFFATSPYIVLNFPKFWQDFSFQQFHMAVGHLLDLGWGWGYHLRFSLFHGLGSFYWLMALLGFLYAGFIVFRKRRLEHACLLAFVLLFYAFVGSTRTVFVRYTLPLIPILAVYAAWIMWKLSRWLLLYLKGAIKLPLRLGSWRVTMLIYPLLVLLVSFQSFSLSYQSSELLSRQDTRTLARDWLLKRLKPNEPVGIGLFLSHLDLPYGFSKYYLSPPEDKSPTLTQYSRRFMQMPEAYYGKMPTLRHEFALSTYRYPRLLRALGIRYVAVAHSPLLLFNPPLFELAALKKHCRLVATFRPEIPGSALPARTAYDQIDAFFLPFATLSGVARPGPTIYIFEVPASIPAAVLSTETPPSANSPLSMQPAQGVYHPTAEELAE
ncbi:MAG: phospholipid carrier-dependent glycosyltransferase [Candidatus Melainabacteria bacterium]|nr:phospholipid carrier-dependent glycosyltransferase [Candidatus Melainabacteria bacterium]